MHILKARHVCILWIRVTPDTVFCVQLWRTRLNHVWHVSEACPILKSHESWKSLCFLAKHLVNLFAFFSVILNLRSLMLEHALLNYWSPWFAHFLNGLNFLALVVFKVLQLVTWRCFSHLLMILFVTLFVSFPIAKDQWKCACWSLIEKREKKKADWGLQLSR